MSTVKSGITLVLALVLGLALSLAPAPKAEAAKAARFAHNMPPKPQLLYHGAARGPVRGRSTKSPSSSPRSFRD